MPATPTFANLPAVGRWAVAGLVACLALSAPVQAQLLPDEAPAYAYMAISSASQAPAASSEKAPEKPAVSMTGLESLQASPVQQPPASPASLPPLTPRSGLEPVLESQDPPDVLLTPLRVLQGDPAPPAATSSSTGKGSLQQPFQMKEVMVYSDLPAIAVFAVPHHGTDKAFGDVALLLANEYAAQLERRFPNTRIHAAEDTLTQARREGLEGVYRELLRHYVRAGRPDPRALAYLLEKLSAQGPAISRVIFVEADVDLHHPTTSYRPMDVVRRLHSGALPPEQRYYVHSRVEVYDVSQPQVPRVWAFSWKTPVKTTGLYNVTASVFQDSDSLGVFSMAARTTSKILTTVSPKIAYMKGERQTITLVNGQIQPPQASPAKVNGLPEVERRRLERLLRDPAS